jgi:hypothetical protein
LQNRNNLLLEFKLARPRKIEFTAQIDAYRRVQLQQDSKMHSREENLVLFRIVFELGSSARTTSTK